MTPQEKDELQKAIVRAVHESFSSAPSGGTQEMFNRHQLQLDGLTSNVNELTKKVDTLLDLIGNLKFSGKAVFWIGSGIIGLVGFFTAGKAFLAWFGVSVIKQ